MNWDNAITVLSLILAIAAWIAKIIWSEEYSKAKEETIRTKDAQIAFLESTIQTYKDLTPDIIWKQYEAIKKASEEFIKVNDKEKMAAQEALQIMQNDLDRLTKDGDRKSALIIENKEKYDALEKEYNNVKTNLENYKRNPLSIFEGTALSTSASSIAISGILHRDTIDNIEKVTIPFKVDENTLKLMNNFYGKIYKITESYIGPSEDHSE